MATLEKAWESGYTSELWPPAGRTATVRSRVAPYPPPPVLGAEATPAVDVSGTVLPVQCWELRKGPES